MQKKVEELIKESCDKFNIPYEVGEKIFLSQFKMVRDSMKKIDLKDESTFKNMRIKHLCLFYTRPNRINNLVKHYESLSEHRISEETIHSSLPTTG